MPPFAILPFNPALAKSFTIEGPDYLLLTVDYDDVDHDAVEDAAHKLVAILNREWCD